MSGVVSYLGKAAVDDNSEVDRRDDGVHNTTASNCHPVKITGNDPAEQSFVVPTNAAT